jgi:hypothetical protein
VIFTSLLFPDIVLASQFLESNLSISCDLQPADGRNCIADEHYLPTLFNVSIYNLSIERLHLFFELLANCQVLL